MDGNEIGAGWRRTFRFRIPVREPDRWGSEPVRGALASVLGFLSEDEYTFEFPHLRHDHPLEDRLDFDTTPWGGHVQEVMLFSGGLDSLAGAVREPVVDRRQVLLVNHRSTEKLTPSHEALVRALEKQAAPFAPVHVPVWVNKAKRLGRESTQRTRSFLFAALGAVFARMIGLARVRFYENGVTSLNLPPVGQVVGARASRTTHPRTLAGFGTFFSELFAERFVVENPFQWDTKTDVVKRVADAGCGELIGMSRSCASTWQAKTKTHSHCGVCSQCIDRRFAVLASGQAGHDPATGYAVDLLTGARDSWEPVAMLSAYVSLSERIEQTGEADFVAQFGELARALPHLGMSPSAGMSQVFDLHKRHARQVAGVISDAIRQYANRFRRRDLPTTCLLRLVCDDTPRTAADGCPAEPVRPAGNYFLRRGDIWAVRFGEGEEKLYQADVGFAYLRVLVGQPRREFTPSELETRARGSRGARPSEAAGAAAASGELGAGAEREDVALDDQAVESYRERLREIERDLDELGDNEEPWATLAAAELTRDRDFIRGELLRATGLRGRRRAIASDAGEQVRKRVCAAITRACKDIAKYDPPLAEHLNRSRLLLGRQIVYQPGADTVWVTEEVSVR